MLDKDGSIDYSNFSYSELAEARRSINANQYPKNYRNLVEAISRIEVSNETPAHSGTGRDTSTNWFWPDPLNEWVPSRAGIWL
jgi:hypothetical protein